MPRILDGQVIDYSPEALERVKGIITAQLDKALTARGAAAREGLVCGGTGEQFAQEALDGAEHIARQAHQDRSPSNLRDVAMWALLAAALLEEGQ